MKTYIISIAIASVISAVMSMLAPEKWSKYVGVVTGLVITLCIGRPVLEIMKADVFEGLKFDYSSKTGYSHEEYRREVMAELEKQIAEDVKARLKKEFNADCDITVTLGVNEHNEITGIRKFKIVGDRLDSVARGRLRDIYEVCEIE